MKKSVRKKSEMNKRAAEMTIGTIVVIILAIVVLVILVYGFTVGWGDLFNRLTGLGSGQVNVQIVVQSCQIACSTQAKYEWCQKTRRVVFDDTGKENVDNGKLFKCVDLATTEKNTRYNLGLESCNLDCLKG